MMGVRFSRIATVVRKMSNNSEPIMHPVWSIRNGVNAEVLQLGVPSGILPLTFYGHVTNIPRCDIDALGHSAVLITPSESDEIKRLKAQIELLTKERNAALVDRDKWAILCGAEDCYTPSSAKPYKDLMTRLALMDEFKKEVLIGLCDAIGCREDESPIKKVREVAERCNKLSVTVETLARELRACIDSRNAHATNYRKSEIKRLELERELKALKDAQAT
jgi:hypothetical protein